MQPRTVTLEAWRAEHRIRVALEREEGVYAGAFELPEEGPWMLLLRVDAGEESLLTTQQIEVTVPSAPSGSRAHMERFTLGLDTLKASDPPAWLDAIAYGVSLVILLLLLRGLLRALRGLQNEQPSGRGAVGPAAL